MDLDLDNSHQEPEAISATVFMPSSGLVWCPAVINGTHHGEYSPSITRTLSCSPSVTVCSCVGLGLRFRRRRRRRGNSGSDK